MRSWKSVLLVLVLLAGLFALGNRGVVAQVESNDYRITVVDDCLPGDTAWNPTGGCTLEPHQGDVPAAEFSALLTSPLTSPPNGFLIGHPSWRNEPSHLTAPQGKTVVVTNRGGRGHTFTEVANFGGGFVPPLNIGLTQATEPRNGSWTRPSGL